MTDLTGKSQRARISRLGYGQVGRRLVDQCGGHGCDIANATVGGNVTGRNAVHPVTGTGRDHVENEIAVAETGDISAGQTHAANTGDSADARTASACCIGARRWRQHHACGQGIGDRHVSERNSARIGKTHGHSGQSAGGNGRRIEAFGRRQRRGIGQRRGTADDRPDVVCCAIGVSFEPIDVGGIGKDTGRPDDVHLHKTGTGRASTDAPTTGRSGGHCPAIHGNRR